MRLQQQLSIAPAPVATIRASDRTLVPIIILQRITNRLLGSEISRYIVAGGFAFVADFAVLWFCKEHLGFHYLYGNLVGYITGLAVSYVLNVLWVFEYRRYKDVSVEFMLFTMIVLAGLCLSEAVMYLLVSHGEINYLYAKFAAAGLVFLFNFVVKKATLFSRAQAPFGREALRAGP